MLPPKNNNCSMCLVKSLPGEDYLKSGEGVWRLDNRGISFWWQKILLHYHRNHITTLTQVHGIPGTRRIERSNRHLTRSTHFISFEIGLGGEEKRCSDGSKFDRPIAVHSLR